MASAPPSAIRPAAAATTRRAPRPGRAAFLPPAVQAHLRARYGARAENVAAYVGQEPDLAGLLSPRHPDIGAQVLYALEVEGARTLADILLPAHAHRPDARSRSCGGRPRGRDHGPTPALVRNRAARRRDRVSDGVGAEFRLPRRHTPRSSGARSGRCERRRNAGDLIPNARVLATHPDLRRLRRQGPRAAAAAPSRPICSPSCTAPDRQRCSRSEFAITLRLESIIASAATIGSRKPRSPNSHSRPPGTGPSASKSG